MSDPTRKTLRTLLNLVTAPFCESAVMDWLRQWSATIGAAACSDEYGNLRIDLDRDGAAPGWLLVAHTDHPGFVAGSQYNETVDGVFYGHLAEEYFPGSVMVWHGPDGPMQATVSAVQKPPLGWGLEVSTRLAEPAEVPAGTPGMWNLPAMQIRGHRLRSRACDDLAGLGIAVAALQRWAESGQPGRLSLLATRAEEAGLLGAMGACRSGLVAEGMVPCSIETSSVAGGQVRMGGGVVVRTGDRLSTFDPGGTESLSAACRDLANEEPDFQWQRALMAGGVCEATVFQKFGHRAAAVCIALGNYHNAGPDGVVAPEFVDLRDIESAVTLLSALATRRPEAVNQTGSDHFDRLWEQRSDLLRTTAD